jgi:hypothetical protein
MARGFLSEGGGAGRSNLVDVEVVIRRETAGAWGIADPDKAGNIIWLPKSQCEVDGDNDPSRRATVTMPSWLASEKGLI